MRENQISDNVKRKFTNIEQNGLVVVEGNERVRSWTTTTLFIHSYQPIILLQTPVHYLTFPYLIFSLEIKRVMLLVVSFKCQLI